LQHKYWLISGKKSMLRCDEGVVKIDDADFRLSKKRI